MINQISFEELTHLSKRDIAYKINPEKFKDFISFMPSTNGLKQAIKAREKFPINRRLLVKEINRQYAHIQTDNKVLSNISALESNDTYTIITAHQPCLFTGPLYYIYKIFSCINLADKLSQESNKKIIPVFINGSEDHDFEEINHCRIFGKTITWNRVSKGAVGRLDLEKLENSIYELSSILGDGVKAKTIVHQLKKSLKASSNYNDFVFRFLNYLFEAYGLVIVSMDNKAMKAAFSNVIKEELIQSKSQELVLQTQEELEKTFGFKAQAHAREINLFYLNAEGRRRIVKEKNQYSVIGSDIRWSEDQILKEVNKFPENFSPNVILRPIYQESIFPNVAYVGGGGELAYWMERKSLFNHYKTFFPVLIRRNSAMIIPSHISKTINKLGLQVSDFFIQEDKFIKEFTQNSTLVNFEIEPYKKALEEIFNNLKKDAKKIDNTLVAYIQKNLVNQQKNLSQIESKFIKFAQDKNSVQTNQIKKVFNYLFPSQGLQERSTNIFEFLTSDFIDIFEILKREMHPLDKEFLIINS